MSAAANGPTHLMAERSARVRDERTAIRRGLRGGTLTFAELFADPPACLAGVPIFSLLLWRRGWGRHWLRVLGAQAVRDQINLGVSVGDASRRTLDWLAEKDATTGRWVR